VAYCSKLSSTVVLQLHVYTGDERSRQKGDSPVTLCCLCHTCCFHGEILHAKSQAGSAVASLEKPEGNKMSVSHLEGCSAE
jgi:hypothetical protein